MDSLLDYCKPCPECEWGWEVPNVYIEMSDAIYSGGAVKYVEKEYASLECRKCNYKLYAKSVREAISKWNEEYDKNAKENHIHKVICKRCGEKFDEFPDPEKHIKETSLDLSKRTNNPSDWNGMGYSYILPCCKYESERFLRKNGCVNHFKNQFKEVTFQREIDYKEEN